MRNREVVRSSLICMFLLLSGCVGSNRELSVTSTRARAAGKGMNSAIYMQIQNGPEADALIGAACDAAQMVQLHLTTIDGNGTAVMQQQARIELEPGGILNFEPGGYHIMLVNLNDSLSIGQTIGITLIFERAGEYHVSVPVEAD